MSSFLYPKELLCSTRSISPAVSSGQADLFCLPQPNYLVASLAIASPAQISGRVSIERRYLKRSTWLIAGRAVLLLLTVPNTAQHTECSSHKKVASIHKMPCQYITAINITIAQWPFAPSHVGTMNRLRSCKDKPEQKTWLALGSTYLNIDY